MSFLIPFLTEIVGWLLRKMPFGLSTILCFSGENTGLRSKDLETSVVPPLVSWVTTGKFLGLIYERWVRFF